MLLPLKLPQLEGAKGRPSSKLGEWCRGVFAIWLVDLAVLRLEGAKGRPRTQKWGDAAGLFLQSVWWKSQYPCWKVLRGFLAPNIGGEAFRGVFTIGLVALTVPQLEGAQRLPGAQHWRGGLQGCFCDLPGDTHTTPIGRC